GLPVWALWQHYERDRDIEFIRPLYRKLVRTGADFMATYREPHTKLPAPSFDLWEERRGIHAFTTAAVWAGLTAARNFAVAFGQHELAKRYAVAATEIRDAALIHLWDADRGRFLRTVNILPDGTIVKDATIDISLAGIFLFGLLPANDPRVVSTMRAVEDRLTVRTPVGGVARYENDYYFQVSPDIPNVPGNPWFVATLWLAEHYIALAEDADALAAPRAFLEWCATRALPSGVLSEQVHPYTGEPLSVSPLTWSHAAFVSAVQRYARGRIVDLPPQSAPATPTLHPSGKSLVFAITQQPNKKTGFGSDLFTVNLDGTGLRPVVEHEADNVFYASPRFDSTGNVLYFHRRAALIQGG